MATRTSYLNLIKPDYTDAADIADINANMDTLDNTIQGLDETGSKSLTAHNNATDAHQPILNAIKAISGMSEYDIAPSKTIDAIIPLLGFGGIVAQKLEARGYVKFANGLCIQWGMETVISGSPKTINFPIAFNTLFNAYQTSMNGATLASTSGSANKTGITLYSNLGQSGAYITILAIGLA